MSTRLDDPYRIYPPEEGSDEAEQQIRSVSRKMRETHKAMEKEARREALLRFRQSTMFYGLIALVALIVSPFIVAAVALLVRLFITISGV